MKTGDKVYLVCVDGYCVDNPEEYLRQHKIQYKKFLGYSSMGERWEFLVDELPKTELPRYVFTIEYEARR